MVYPRHLTATSPEQMGSLAESRLLDKYARYEQVTLEDRQEYFEVSCNPITKGAEDDMELLSDLITWGELYTDSWENGNYACARCERVLYSSSDKWRGPCVWPSFRSAASEGVLLEAEVSDYNNYQVAVREIYCGGCELFVGHAFEDGPQKGDSHPEARWRH